MQLELYAGIDSEKDQSYFLWMVPEEALRHTLFPVGDKTKTQVRALAKKFGLPNAERPDSQGLCFLGDISIQDLLTRELTLIPGNVLDESGVIIGRHEGVASYTLGQRHGFELFVQHERTVPHYIIAKNSKDNTITISENKFPHRSHKTSITLINTNWIGEVPNGPCRARYRYRQVLISADKKGNTVCLHEPHYVPSGQSLVLYHNDRCFGGGIIDDAWLS
jgi:tRNA-uridine 2-sulfurtransferase